MRKVVTFIVACCVVQPAFSQSREYAAAMANARKPYDNCLKERRSANGVVACTEAWNVLVDMIMQAENPTLYPPIQFPSYQLSQTTRCHRIGITVSCTTN